MATEDNQQPMNIFAEEEALILAAIAERIFPKTDTPGAVEIGAVSYIEIALAGDYAALAPLYHLGLRAIQRYSRGKFNKKFLDLGDGEKDAVLKDFEAGAVENFKTAAEFFETVRYHVLEGVFCEPQYGGNKDMAGCGFGGISGEKEGFGGPRDNKTADVNPAV